MGLSIHYSIIFVRFAKNNSLKPIDNTVPSMVKCYQMDDAQSLLATLKAKGWTNYSVADAIGVTPNAVEKWQANHRNISQSHLILLNQLLKKNPPKKRRYAKGSRVGKNDG